MLDTVLHAVADPTRRAILDRLHQGPARVTALAEPFAMSLNAVSKHIKVLEAARLVRRTKQGREHTLVLEPAPLRQVAQWAAKYEREWTERYDRLEAFLEQEAADAPMPAPPTEPTSPTKDTNR
jgi:DNA-binding transcriptional ArsR family regulator